MAPSVFEVTLDGDTREWPGGVVATADEHHLYLRFSIQDRAYSIQNHDQSLVVLLDADGSTASGRVDRRIPLNTLGVDLEVHFSPEGDNGRLRPGAAIFEVDAAGNRNRVSLSDWDVSVSPTFASAWYEMRISRTPKRGPGGTPSFGLLSSGVVRGMVTAVAPGGRITGYSDPFEATCESVCSSGDKLADVNPPAKQQGGVRIVSWNVKRSAPLTNAAPFQRKLLALDPDIILMQEWEDGDAAAVQGWLTAMLPGEPVWNVRKAPGTNADGGGVLIATRWPILGGSDGIRSSSERGDKPIRFTHAKIDTPYGVFDTASVHLKCCGAADGPEDRQRIAEARAINRAMIAAIDGPYRIIAGDLNLVGTRPPLDILRSGLDGDGSDLVSVDARTLGDQPLLVTWADPGTPFSPGRLDYVLVSDATLDVASSFILDTGRLTDEALARLGLDREDSRASDHLPIVVDVLPR